MSLPFLKDTLDAARAYRDAQAYLSYMKGESPHATGASTAVSAAVSAAVNSAVSAAVNDFRGKVESEG